MLEPLSDRRGGGGGDLRPRELAYRAFIPLALILLRRAGIR